MIAPVIFAALSPSAPLEDPIAWAKATPWISIPLALSALAILAMVLIRARRLPSDLRARKDHTLDPSQLEDLMLGNPPQVIDLRETREFREGRGHIRGSVNIPFAELRGRLHELDTSHPRPIVLVDETDALSHRAIPLLSAEGHQWLYVLRGGLRAWRRSKMPVYRPSGSDPTRR